MCIICDTFKTDPYVKDIESIERKKNPNVSSVISECHITFPGNTIQYSYKIAALESAA